MDQKPVGGACDVSVDLALAAVPLPCNHMEHMPLPEDAPEQDAVKN